MARENARTKGQRYLTEGRLTVNRVAQEPFQVVAYCRGDSGEVYRCGYGFNTLPKSQRWMCECPALTDQCSHLVALRLVTVRPTERQAA